MPRLGLLIPEFPTQTHIAMWRLGEAMRRAGIEVELLSTRRPRDEAAVHPSLEREAERTFYCWPARSGALLAEAVRCVAGLPRAVWYAATLRESDWKGRARVLGLVLPALALRRRARKRQLDHVFVHSCASAAHVAALCRVIGGPRYSLRLGGDIDVYGRDQASKMRRATVVVGAARVNMEQAIERARLAPQRAMWSWLGVDTAAYHPGTHASDSRRPMRLVTVARLNHAKGHRFVLDAIALAATKGVEVRYTIVGDGPERTAIADQVRSLELDGRVEMTGALDEDGVRAALQMAEVFVLPTSGPGEGSPVAVLEAMSAGLAILATDVGGLGEMVDDREGVLVPPGDAGALAGALITLASNPGRRAAMGAAARERAVREFDVGAVADRLIARFFPRFVATEPSGLAAGQGSQTPAGSGVGSSQRERMHDAA